MRCREAASRSRCCDVRAIAARTCATICSRRDAARSDNSSKAVPMATPLRVTTCSARAMLTGSAFPVSRRVSSSRLAGAGLARSERACSRSGLSAMIRPSRNSSSSTASSLPALAADSSSASWPSRTSVSTMSEVRDQFCATAVVSTAWVATLTLPPKTRSLSSARAEPGTDTSASATRSERWSSSTATTANSSDPVVAATLSLPVRAARSASRDRELASRLAAYMLLTFASLPSDPDAGIGGIELAQEALDRCGLLGLVRNRLTDDLLGQVDGRAADFGAQLGEDLLALGFQLCLARGHDAVALGLGLGAHLREDLLALRTRFLTDARGLQPGVGQLLLVLLQRLLRLGLRGLGLRDPALDLLAAFVQNLGQARDDELVEERGDDHDADDRPDDVVRRGEKRIDVLFRLRCQYCVLVHRNQKMKP